MATVVNFFNESDTKYLPRKKAVETVTRILADEKKSEAVVNIIVLDDDNIRSINKQYLDHDYATDVISFTIDEIPFLGEIYISSDTAKKQAEKYNVSLANETVRLAAHGALHLCGYEDDTDEKRKLMHDLEDKYLGMIWKE